uniref:Uncharacterized protein n=1 Tax=Amphimedon queenslandica TaxID=400682 RepID=A0A1X7STH5_AMPQE
MNYVIIYYHQWVCQAKGNGTLIILQVRMYRCNLDQQDHLDKQLQVQLIHQTSQWRLKYHILLGNL